MRERGARDPGERGMWTASGNSLGVGGGSLTRPRGHAQVPLGSAMEWGGALHVATLLPPMVTLPENMQPAHPHGLCLGLLRMCTQVFSDSGPGALWDTEGLGGRREPWGCGLG